MGYISNQWLDGAPLRSRISEPIPATITGAVIPANHACPWDIEHNISAELRVERSNGDYQYLCFTDDDMGVFAKVVGAASQEIRQSIALAAMSEATEQELVSFMQALFDQRAKRTA